LSRRGVGVRFAERRTARASPPGGVSATAASRRQRPYTGYEQKGGVLAGGGASHVVRDAPWIDTCASTPRLWSDQGIRDPLRRMGGESLAKGIRTCAPLVLTTVAITDHRYLCPAPSAARRKTRTTHWSTQVARGPAARPRRHATRRNPRGPLQPQRTRHRTASNAEPGEAETPRPRLICGRT
jgi:hypothetical protein